MRIQHLLAGLMAIVNAAADPACTTAEEPGTGTGGAPAGGAGGVSGGTRPTVGGATTVGGAGAAQSGGCPYLYGVTADSVADLTGLVDSLQSLPHKPAVRVVFDETESPASYAQAIPALHEVSYVMGTIVDADYVADFTVEQYTQRTRDYLAAFPTDVDLWEVGNEINGNWLDTTPGGVQDVIDKMTGAFDLVQIAGKRTALTLYGCNDADRSHDMLNWVRQNVPSRMLKGLNYVLVSFYEGDCGVPAPDWAAVFGELHALFPNACLGFGECGAVDANGNDITNVSLAGPYLRRYYGLKVDVPNYVGGYFWWYFYEDMVPKTKPMFPILSAAMQ